MVKVAFEKTRPEPLRSVIVPLGAKREPVTFTKPMVEVPTVAEPAAKVEPTRLEKKPFVEVTLVNVAFVARRLVILPEFAIKEPKAAFAAKKFVEVALVVVPLRMVTLPKLPFQRRDGVPRE